MSNQTIRTPGKPEAPLPLTAARGELLSRDDIVAEYGAPSKRWLELAATRGDGPPMIRLGWRTVRYRRGDFEDWLASRTVASTAQKVEA